jgi:choice-of-anchor B domain-containing protein
MNVSVRIVLLAAGVALGACGGGDGEPSLQMKSSLDLASIAQPGASGSGNWGYTAPDGRRFALTGTSAGLSIVEVSDPQRPRPIALIPGPDSLWREVKTFGTTAYVTTEASSGLDIVDLSEIDHPRKVRTWNKTFTSAHTCWVDAARKLLFVNGTRDAARQFSGMHVLDLSRDPLDPTDLGAFTEFYVHDSYSRGNLLFASAIYDGFLAVLDVSDPGHPRDVNRFFTGGRFTHNSWLSTDGRTLFTTDEVAGRPLEGWDVSDLTNPRKISEYISAPGTLPHNVMVDGNRLLVAHYAEGVHLVDITDPAHPQRMGSFDTYPAAECPDLFAKPEWTKDCHDDGCGDGSGANVFCGVWGAYIFPGTGLIVASDMQSGLFVLEYGS